MNFHLKSLLTQLVCVCAHACNANMEDDASALTLDKTELVTAARTRRPLIIPTKPSGATQLHTLATHLGPTHTTDI